MIVLIIVVAIASWGYGWLMGHNSGQEEGKQRQILEERTNAVLHGYDNKRVDTPSLLVER